MLRYMMLSICCIVFSISAKEPAFLKGRVLDRETGEGIAGAVVAIKEMWPAIGHAGTEVDFFRQWGQIFIIHTTRYFR
jgi:hypothetical protein